MLGGKSTRFSQENIVSGWNSGVELVELIEVLSGHSMPNKDRKVNIAFKSKGRIQQVNSCAEAINWALAAEQGVKITLKPSAENLVDALEVPVLGMVWNVIYSYLNVGDDDDRLSATEALLKWVRRETAGYAGVDVTDFKGSWYNGLAFCALIHKHRPDLIGKWEDLDAANAHENIARAQEGAYQFFRLEKYIQPDEISILDEKSMIIYVSEFYAGITGFQKLIQGAKRITDFIAFNKAMDDLKHRYVELATKLKAKFDPAVAMLLDETVDNTYAGAERRLNDFLAFKEQVKDALTAEFLELEALMNQIASRLASANRPAFVPPAGLTVPELRDQFKTVESAEARRHAALVKEFNRQVSLRTQAAQHAARVAKVDQRVSELSAQMAALEPAAIERTADAKFHVNSLKAVRDELAALKSESLVAKIKPITAHLATEQYESLSELTAAEDAEAVKIDALLATVADKTVAVDAALALNEYRDEVRSLAAQHRAREAKLTAWADEILRQISELKDVSSITATQGSLSQLKVLQGDRAEHNDNHESFVSIGDKIKAAKKDAWVPDAATQAAVDSSAQAVTEKLAAVDAALAEKKTELEAALAANIAADEKHLAFAIQFAAFAQWVKDTVASVTDSDLGFTLAELKAFDVEARNAAASAQAAEKHAAISALATADSASVNPYAGGKGVAEADALKKDIEAALAQRAQRYMALLTKYEHEDAICAAFAAAAEPLVGDINAKKDAITNASGSLEEQASAIAAAKADYAADARLGEIVGKLWPPIPAAGVQANPHTLQTDKSLQTQWAQYGAFLEGKDKIIADLQAVQQLRGLTQEQWDNAKSSFAEFDKDGSGALSADHLRSALHYFGESRSKEEIAAIVAQFGKDGVVTWEQYLDYVVTTLGGQNTKERLEEAFTLINQGHAARIENMKGYFSDEEIAYIMDNAPKDEAGNVDLRAWIHNTYNL
jgi:Ca2+-binding EF-hand superfamily protein